jgi:hypothetical protein
VAPVALSACNHEISPRRARAFGVGKNRWYRRRENEIARAGSARRRFIARTNECELQAVHLDHDLILMTWQRQPVGVPEIGGEDRETGLAYPVEINLLAKVELMIAGHEGIEPHIVEEINHVGTLVEARQQARRQRIAGVDANQTAVLNERSGAFRLYRRRETRMPPRPSFSSIR